jgi:lipid-binding SYLF domain-containing protein
MAEALAAAQTLGGSIAVSSHDVGPNLKAAAEHDHVTFTIL